MSIQAMVTSTARLHVGGCEDCMLTAVGFAGEAAAVQRILPRFGFGS